MKSLKFSYVVSIILLQLSFIITNLCSTFPCLNGGTCSNTQNSFLCMCAPGFSGITCNVGIADCSSSWPCVNRG